MQRKNSVLMTSSRSGFAMILAVIVILVVAGIMTLALTLTSETVKRSGDIYLREQAELLAKSAVELTLLKITKDGCQSSYSPTFDSDIDSLFSVNVSMKYIYSTASTCNDYFQVQTPEQSGSVLMDVVVETKYGVSTEPIRFFRRTLQKL